ncbi:glycosyltransferase family 4 protein [Conexibacter sp. SYSU D00693]|uniref:glycosyltransferase family 4 protein n=1 Tax=Conexibacter sp. SYSU D00693 TaxID=2812560 RepID=UPI00196AE4FD|nr:glycosyltransferase family 4 protein [Conexibacter sp. SYSU D00693]
MHVALLNPVFWPEVRRGSERVARELADGLLARGHRVSLITTHPSLRRTVTEEDGLEVIRCSRPQRLEARLVRRVYDDHLTHPWTALRELRRDPPDVAHALHVTSGIAAARHRHATGTPAVLSYMGIPHRQALVNRRLRLELTQRAVRGASAVVALSDHAAGAFERWLGVDDVRTINPGVDLEAFAPDPAARARQPTVLCAADLAEPRKRVALLVDAFALVREQLPEARLVLSRPKRDVALPDAPGVEVRDLDERAALVRANQEAWVAALPSVGEAFGLVLAEALACGTPVVAADREALPEVAGDERTGRLFAGDDPGAVARALLEALELARDPATAVACRRRAERWGTERCADAYEALYRELLG